MNCICKYCNKAYASYQSRCNHVRRYHNNINKDIEKIKKKKFTCDKCNKNFNTLENITEHIKNDCRPSVKSNNIYTFKTETLGKNKYKKNNGGDIYIIQTEFHLKGFYKIGVSTNLHKRLGQYRCGSVLEPKLHYYYPCKNIKETDKILKLKLKKFNVKREIYKSDNIDDLRNLIKEIQKNSNSSELEIIPENKECDIRGCNYCDLYFTNLQDLNIHVNNIHKEIIIDNDKYICKNCNKSYKHRQGLWKHSNNCKKNNELEKIKEEFKEEIEEYNKELIVKMKIEINNIFQNLLNNFLKNSDSIELDKTLIV